MKIYKFLSVVLLPVIFLGSPFSSRADTTPVTITSPTLGVDQVLGALAGIIQKQARLEALQVIKNNFAGAIAGKNISFKIPGPPVASVTLYIGKLPDSSKVSTPYPDLYFQETYNRLMALNTNFSDPNLIQSACQDTIALLMRLSLDKVGTQNIGQYHLDEFAKFAFNTIQTMSQKGASAYSLGSPLLILADQLSDTSAVKVDLQFKKYLGNLGKKTSEYRLKLKIASKKRMSTEELKAAIGKEFFAAQVDETGIATVAKFIRIIGQTLVAYQNDAPHTDTFYQKLLGDIETLDLSNPTTQLSSLNPPSTVPSIAFLQSDFQDALPYLYTALTLADNQLDTAEFKNLILAIQQIQQTIQTSAANVPADLAQLLGRFATLAQNLGNSSSATPGISALVEFSKIFGDISNKQWVSLATDISALLAGNDANGNPIQHDLDPRGLRFVGIILEMYQAPTQADAENILEENLETIESRDSRYHSNQDVTVDLTGLFGIGAGWTGRAQYLNQGSCLLGPYVPVGVQFSFGTDVQTHVVGFMFYPFDLGSYITGEDSTVRFQDAFRLGGALCVRLGIPIDFGFGTDFKSSDPSAWRVLGFASVEVPLFQLN